MKGVDTIARVRREFHQRKRSIKQIARELHISRNTVRKILRSDATAFSYERERQPLPKIGPWKGELDRMLFANEGKAARERLTLIRIYEELQGLGFAGGYDAVRRYARSWDRERGAMTAEAFVPLVFAPGEAYQFDWSHEVVLIGGTTVTVKVAHLRLCHSRMLFVRAYPRETKGDGVRRARPGVRLFQGSVHARHLRQHEDGGRDRVHRQRAPVQLALRTVDEPSPDRADGLHAGGGLGEGPSREPGWRCTEAVLRASWRSHASHGRPSFKTLDDLNGWLADKCIAYAKVQPHPEQTDKTVFEMFEAERPVLMAYVGAFDGFHATTASVSKTCLVRFDRNKYSVQSSAVGRPVDIHAYADRIVIKQDGVVVGVVQEGVLDQGQLEGGPVLGLNAAGMLARGRVWRELGGFDPVLPSVVQGLEFCWRARLRGHQVITQPRARVVHVEASTRGLREGADLDPAEARRRWGLTLHEAFRPTPLSASERGRLGSVSTQRVLGHLAGKNLGDARLERRAVSQYLSLIHI